MADAASAAVTSDSVRRPIVLGVSLKLYLDIAETRAWARVVATIARGTAAVRDRSVRLFVLPSLPALDSVKRELAGTLVEVGAQDLHWVDRGAYTGAVSGTDLREIGCQLVEVGHAERRQVFGEDDDMVRGKLAAAIRNGLTPVLCIGEPQRTDAAEAALLCVAQLESALAGVAHPAAASELVLAYEPAWAIGQSTPAPADHIAVVTAALRERIAQETWLSASWVIYGGGAQRGLLRSLGQSVDGLFLGRFAHDPAELGYIIDEAAALV